MNKKQSGGNDLMKIPDIPKAHFTDSALLEIPTVSADNFLLSGGKCKGKGKKAKKAVDKKKPVAAAEAAPKPKKKKGGNLVDSMRSLAVPFAILLAKQGLDGMFNKKTKTEDKGKSVKAKTVKIAKASSQRRRTATGGGCDSCAKVGGDDKISKVGGDDKISKMGGVTTSRYAQLSSEIDTFLKKY